ncbi:MAG: hypothetical protein GC139_09705 [Sideroxydans sp.]|nr:hypothetical protein [Sideroxydans sp.]
MKMKSAIRGLQRGFSIMTAIFLLVVLGALGAMMLTFSTTQQQSSMLDVMGSRAYQAARAGIEWGAFHVVQSSVDGGAFAGACLPGPATSPALTLGGTLAVFNVTVSCSATSYTEGGVPLTVYRITSTAKSGAGVGQANYVERVVSATIAK